MERKLENEGRGETLENKKTREMETKNTTVKMLVLKNVGIPGIHKRASMRTSLLGSIDASDSESRRIF